MNALHNSDRPHFVLVPQLSQGHIIPMVDMARLLASRGAIVSFITTPVNAARIKPVIDHAHNTNLPIRFIEFDFPGKETGVPDGCENFDQIPPQDVHLYAPFFEAIALLRHPLRQYLQNTNPKPRSMITDYINWWTAEIAREMNVPRFIFHGPGCFFILASRNIRLSKVNDGVADDNEIIVVPGLPHRIEITKQKALGGGLSSWPEWEAKVVDAEDSADGIVINTFQELEREYIQLLEKDMGKLVLPIGPLSLCNNDITSKATRGNKSSIEESKILNWLDSKAKKSVLFISFGTIARTGPTQLTEIGRALEASKYSFIWVIKNYETHAVEELMGEGFRERTKERGLIITGWAPQVVILSHAAVGGFVTHCGWNSILESVTAGVPMIAWPHSWDQFLNERLIVDVLRVGVSVGNKVPSFFFKEEEVTADHEALGAAIEKLMGGGEDVEERRVRADKYGEMALKAMDEGGSSFENLTTLVQFAMEHK